MLYTLSYILNKLVGTCCINSRVYIGICQVSDFVYVVLCANCYVLSLLEYNQRATANRLMFTINLVFRRL